MTPTLVFAPGAWHTPDYFDEVRKLAHDKYGYPSEVVSFPTFAAEPPLKDNEKDVAATREVVSKLVEEEGKDVILVMHSYAGIPGCSALKGLAKVDQKASGKKGGVTHLVFVACILTPVGVPLVKWRTVGLPPWQQRTEDGRLLANGAQDIFYNDLPAEVADERAAMVKHHSACLATSAVTYAAWEAIPSTWVICEKDKTKPLEMQYEFRKLAGDLPIEKMPSGHVPFLSMPDATIDLIHRAATA